jgi:hypothetical protein
MTMTVDPISAESQAVSRRLPAPHPSAFGWIGVAPFMAPPFLWLPIVAFVPGGSH